MEHLHIPLVLDHGEFRKNLNTELHVRMLADSNVEAAFTIYEADDPLSIEVQLPVLNVKSLRVPARAGLPCGLSPCPPDCYCQGDP